MIICSWFPVFFDVALRILCLNDLTSWINLVLKFLNASKKTFLNWWNCSVISSFSVSIPCKFSFGSDIHPRYLNVLTITDSFSIKDIDVSVKTSEDGYTLLAYHIFLFLFSMCIDGKMRSVNSSSVIVTIDSKSEFASSIF